MATHQTHEAWIAHALGARQSKDEETGRILTDDTGEEGKPCSVIALVHMVGTTQKEILSRKITGRDSAKILADIFEHRARAYCQDLPGAQTFNLLAFYGASTPGDSHPFIITVESAAGHGNGLFTESPNAEGLAQQAMRHAEVMTQIFVRGLGDTFGMQREMMSELRRENVSLRTENFEALTIVKQMVLQAGAESDERKLRIERARLVRESTTKLLTMIPALANTVTGKEVFPQATADSAIVELFCDAIAKMPEDQVMNLISSLKLPPEAIGVIMTRAKQFLDKKADEDKAANLIPVPAPELAEADAGGGAE